MDFFVFVRLRLHRYNNHFEGVTSGSDMMKKYAKVCKHIKDSINNAEQCKGIQKYTKLRKSNKIYEEGKKNQESNIKYWEGIAKVELIWSSVMNLTNIF